MAISGLTNIHKRRPVAQKAVNWEVVRYFYTACINKAILKGAGHGKIQD